jgi:ParB-like chromosome segregation protein Spo0J
MTSPVWNIKAIPIEQIDANSYNPNHVAPPEMRLLYESIKEDGYTMPVVVYPKPDGRYEIVDGYHRYTVMLTHRDIYERERGLLPCSILNKDVSNRMASTIRHNRARGSHSIELMMNIVGELKKAGMSDAWIMKEIGMDADELLRYKQLSGLAELFKDRDYSKAKEL